MENLNFAPALRKNIIHTFLSLTFIVLVLSSCDPYQKLLKSSDYKLKLSKSKEFYNEGKYTKAIPLFEELISVYKGTEDVEDLYFFYPFCHYGTGDYLLSTYYFRRFVEYYPKSLRAEEARFMSAYSLYKLSPLPSLEQDYTQDAIDAFQLFINNYPMSQKVTEANSLIDELRMKLEKKAIASAQLYFDMKDYKAAGVAFNNLLLDFPGTDEEERIRYTILESNFLLAENSIRSKQEERYETTIDAFRSFKKKYPESNSLKEAKRMNKESKLAIEDIYFNDIKNALTAGNRAFRENKMTFYDEAISSYEIFLEKYPESSRLRDAEKLYNQCMVQIDKLEKKGSILNNLLGKEENEAGATTE